MPVEISLTDTQEIDFTASPVNSKNEEVPSELPVQFNVVSGDVTLVPLSPNSVTVRSGDNPGDSVVSIATADGDPMDTLTVHVSEEGAVGFSFATSEPRPKQ